MLKPASSALVPGSMSPSAGDPAVFDQDGPEICWRAGPDGTTIETDDKPRQALNAAGAKDGTFP
jgi:hypothetical protein